MRMGAGSSASLMHWISLLSEAMPQSPLTSLPDENLKEGQASVET